MFKTRLYSSLQKLWTSIPPSHVNSAFQTQCQVACLRAKDLKDFDEADLTSSDDDQHSNCPILDILFDSIGSEGIYKMTTFIYPEIKPMFNIFQQNYRRHVTLDEVDVVSMGFWM